MAESYEDYERVSALCLRRLFDDSFAVLFYAWIDFIFTLSNMLCRFVSLPL